MCDPRHEVRLQLIKGFVKLASANRIHGRNPSDLIASITTLIQEASRFDNPLHLEDEWNQYVAIQARYFAGDVVGERLMDLHMSIRLKLCKWFFGPQTPQDSIRALQDSTYECSKLTKFVKYECDFCKVPYFRLKLCSGCRLNVFCSRQCQRNSWPRHKALCKEVSKGSAMDADYAFALLNQAFANGTVPTRNS